MAQQQVGCRGAHLGGLCVGLWHLVWSGHPHQGGLEGVGVEAPSSSDMLDVLPSHRDPRSLGLVFSRPLLLSFALLPGGSTPRADTGCAGRVCRPPGEVAGVSLKLCPLPAGVGAVLGLQNQRPRSRRQSGGLQLAPGRWFPPSRETGRIEDKLGPGPASVCFGCPPIPSSWLLTSTDWGGSSLSSGKV